ncbi:TetR family transcriptional regulator [Actinomycetospora atypica]|uniref:TetR family transcriptional regulator n=1 Tax=Actinomycetospora atypica TaxID=1290095 RepID=A0ABV9YIK6_9PSEU
MTPPPPRPVPGHRQDGLHQQYRDLLRERVLETASTAATQFGWERVRIADLAKLSGVSRSALARVFGDKDGIATALVAHEADRVIARVGQALLDAPNLEAGLLTALRIAVSAREGQPFLAAVLDADHGDTALLPLLTTGSAPIIARARLMLTTALRSRRPRLPTAVLDDAADVVVRATLSHLTAPDHDPEAAVARLHRLACRLLDVAVTPA